MEAFFRPNVLRRGHFDVRSYFNGRALKVRAAKLATRPFSSNVMTAGTTARSNLRSRWVAVRFSRDDVAVGHIRSGW